MNLLPTYIVKKPQGQQEVVLKDRLTAVLMSYLKTRLYYLSEYRFIVHVPGIPKTPCMAFLVSDIQIPAVP